MAVSRNVPDNINTAMYAEDTHGHRSPLINNDDPGSSLMNADDPRTPLMSVDDARTLHTNEDDSWTPLMNVDDPRNPLMNDAKLPLINPRENTPKYNEELKAQINEIIRQSEEMDRLLNRNGGLDEAAVIKKRFAEAKHKRKPCWKLLLCSSCCHR
ncbi:uncharacterized protein LOC123536593 [Mercenaria mercenaria]|uniref:uncharacterized protein LOC123536593 n=1 Tax=Mercenaria mercenaria TaxID=6596 RepID=UPI00234E3C51|nr:uncharacterized protein LOC123536593 [Mercenaria mercenaria]